MKKTVIFVLCIIALFIPTYMAIAYYISAQNAPIAERTVEKFTLRDIEGNEFIFDKNSSENNDDKELLSFFIDLNDSSKEVSELPKQMKNSKFYEGVYKTYNKDKIYKYYFTTNPEEAYYVDSNENAFRIDAKKAAEFLSMKYAESSFESAKEPTLTIMGNDVAEPTFMKWMYKVQQGKYSQTSFTGTNTTSDDVSVSGTFVLDFSTKPDYVNVKLKKGDEIIFDDVYENLTPSDIGEVNSKLDVEITAKWYEANEKDYYGEAKYSFIANVSAPAEFYLGKDTIEQGDVVVLSAKNIVNIEDIKFTSYPEINYKPEFFRDGDYVVALIPISLEWEYAEQYNFNLSAGGVNQNLTLNVTKKNVNKTPITYYVDAEIVNRTRTEATLTAFEQAMKATVENNETTRYFDGNFIEPVSRSIRLGFWRTRKISSTGTSYTHTGVDYVVAAGDQVLATNKGKVVYVGEQIVSGRLVVIDHGCGIKSWYMHMDQISVNKGDIVEKGTVLGTVGATGFTSGLNLHYELTVNGVPVNPYILWNEGLIVKKDS